MELICGSLVSQGGKPQLFIGYAEGTCFKVIFMTGWYLSCEVENKSTHCGVLRGSRGLSGPNSLFGTLKIKSEDNSNNRKQTNQPREIKRQVQNQKQN